MAATALCTCLAAMPLSTASPSPRAAVGRSGDTRRQAYTYTLDSVLVEKPAGWYNTYDGPGALEFSANVTVNISNIVFRDVTNVAAAIVNSAAYSGTTAITFSGCLSLERVFPQFKVGDITDNSTGECAGAIGNGGSADLPNPAPTASACGLPLQGVLQKSDTYALKADCQPAGASLHPQGADGQH